MESKYDPDEFSPYYKTPGIIQIGNKWLTSILGEKYWAHKINQNLESIRYQVSDKFRENTYKTKTLSAYIGETEYRTYRRLEGYGKQIDNRDNMIFPTVWWEKLSNTNKIWRQRDMINASRLPNQCYIVSFKLHDIVDPELVRNLSGYESLNILEMSEAHDDLFRYQMEIYYRRGKLLHYQDYHQVDPKTREVEFVNVIEIPSNGIVELPNNTIVTADEQFARESAELNAKYLRTFILSDQGIS